MTQNTYEGHGTATTETTFRYDALGSTILEATTVDLPGDVQPPHDPSPTPDPPTPEGCEALDQEPQGVPPDAKITRYCHDAFERLVATRGAATDDQGDPEEDHPVEEPANYSYDALDRRATKLAMNEDSELKATGYDHVGLTTRLTREAAEIGENGDSEDDERKSFDVSSSGEYLGITTADDPDADHEFKPYLLDVQGSVEGLEGNDGSVAIDDSYLYSPYGNLENVTGPGEKGLSETASDNPIRFQGFHYDSGIKTYDMHARNYRPGVARFLTEDRYQSAGADQNLVSDPLTQNRYAFLGGNPVSRVEFDGHIAWEYKHIRERRGRKAAERHLNRYYEVSRRSGGAGAAGAPTGGHSTAPLPMPEGVAEPPQHLDQTDLGLLRGIARAEASRMCRRDGRMECNRDRREELAGEIHAAQLFGPDTVHIEDAPAADAVQEKVAIRTSVLHTAVRAGQRSVSRSQKAKRRSARKLLADHGLSSSRVVSPSIEDVAEKSATALRPAVAGASVRASAATGPGRVWGGSIALRPLPTSLRASDAASKMAGPAGVHHVLWGGWAPFISSTGSMVKPENGRRPLQGRRSQRAVAPSGLPCFGVHAAYWAGPDPGRGQPVRSVDS